MEDRARVAAMQAYGKVLEELLKPFGWRIPRESAYKKFLHEDNWKDFKTQPLLERPWSGVTILETVTKVGEEAAKMAAALAGVTVVTYCMREFMIDCVKLYCEHILLGRIMKLENRL